MSDYISFRINTPTVVHEVFDNEIVVIHLDSGNYYTLNDGGAQIWQFLQQGVTRTALLDAFAQANGGVATGIVGEVEQFLDKLQREALVVPIATPEAASATTLVPVPRLTQPSLRKYTDLQDLLFLDPIHDVEETGWPHGKQA